MSRVLAPAYRRSDGTPCRALGLIAAASTLMLALQCRDGRLDPLAFFFLSLTAIAVAVAINRYTTPAFEGAWPRVAGLRIDARFALRAALFVAFAAHLLRPPAIHLLLPAAARPAPFFLGLALAAAVVLLPRGIDATEEEQARESSDFLRRWGLWLRPPVIIGLYLALGTWVIEHSPDPHIDVVVMHREAIAALLHGQNPYTITLPDIYGSTASYYPPGMSVGGRLQLGLIYPPLTLFLTTLGQLAFGDFRYAQLIATAVAAWLLARVRGTEVGLLAAALYLFAPRSFFVIEQGWTEPFVVLMLVLVVFTAARKPRLLPYAAGLLLASKQYSVLLVPLLPWLYEEKGRRARTSAMIIATAVVLTLTLPLMLWDLRAFWQGTVALQAHLPFRPDALALPAVLFFFTGVKLPSALALVVAAVVLALLWRRLPRTPAGFAIAVAVTYFAFFASSKQAFCNYYTLVVGALCAAVASGHWSSAAAISRYDVLGAVDGPRLIFSRARESSQGHLAAGIAEPAVLHAAELRKTRL